MMGGSLKQADLLQGGLLPFHCMPSLFHSHHIASKCQLLLTNIMVMINFEDIVYTLSRSFDVLLITYIGDGLEFEHCVDEQWNAVDESVNGP